jgi:hypothetical protein
VNLPEILQGKKISLTGFPTVLSGSTGDDEEDECGVDGSTSIEKYESVAVASREDVNESVVLLLPDANSSGFKIGSCMR